MEISKRDGTGERQRSFKDFVLANGTVISVFQGSRGQKPDLDIIVKYQERRKQVRTPKHLHWAIDLVIKKNINRNSPRTSSGFFWACGIR